MWLLEATQQSGLLAVDRPTVRFLTVEPVVDRPGRPWPAYREQSSLPVDRPVDRQKAGPADYRDKKLVILLSIKSPNISNNLQK